MMALKPVGRETVAKNFFFPAEKADIEILTLATHRTGRNLVPRSLLEVPQVVEVQLW